MRLFLCKQAPGKTEHLCHSMCTQRKNDEQLIQEYENEVLVARIQCTLYSAPERHYF